MLNAKGIDAADVLACLSTVMMMRVFVEAKLSCCTVQDTLIGLMGNEPVDIGGLIASLVKRCADHLADLCHCVAKYFWTVHADMADGAGRGRAAIDIELVPIASVGAETGGQNAPVRQSAVQLLGLDHDGAGAVAEQDAGRAILPIEDAGEGFGADHQSALELPLFK